jgi:uncharacterized protein HemY
MVQLLLLLVPSLLLLLLLLLLTPVHAVFNDGHHTRRWQHRIQNSQITLTATGKPAACDAVLK